MKKLSKTEMRSIALSATRWQARRLGLEVSKIDSTRALRILDELSYSYPDNTASIWYKSATEAQIRAFRSDWNKYNRGY